MSGDEITLTLPADEEFRRVAHLVIGGLAVRLDLTYEGLEDLELALDALLERTRSDAEVSVRVRLSDGELHTIVGPFDSLRNEFERGDTDDLNLSRILGAVCDSVDISDRDGSQWVQLTKRFETVKGAAR